MYYLAGDIGGTKALLQLIQSEPETHSFIEFEPQRYLCDDFDSLQSIVTSYLSYLNIPNLTIQSACFGLPGPVTGRQVQLTNLPWVVDAELIEKQCSIDSVSFVNDFYAAALGVDTLKEHEVIALYTPKNSVKADNRLVIGAGTGLGVAPVFFDGNHYLPQSSEGGHFDFAPISETQQLLLNWLWQQWDHVSYERVLSGPGLETLYQFFQIYDVPSSFSLNSSQNINKNRCISAQNENVGLVFAKTNIKRPIKTLNAPDIHRQAELKDPAAVKALSEFVTIYGAFIGATALIWNALGGIYLAGGIAAKLIDWMQKPFFVNAFLEKGRMSKVVAEMPIYLVKDESLGLRGALHQAKNTNPHPK
jgi:glucokinase